MSNSDKSSDRDPQTNSDNQDIDIEKQLSEISFDYTDEQEIQGDSLNTKTFFNSNEALFKFNIPKFTKPTNIHEHSLNFYDKAQDYVTKSSFAIDFLAKRYGAQSYFDIVNKVAVSDKRESHFIYYISKIAFTKTLEKFKEYLSNDFNEEKKNIVLTSEDLAEIYLSQYSSILMYLDDLIKKTGDPFGGVLSTPTLGIPDQIFKVLQASLFNITKILERDELILKKYLAFLFHKLNLKEDIKKFISSSAPIKIKFEIFSKWYQENEDVFSDMKLDIKRYSKIRKFSDFFKNKKGEKHSSMMTAASRKVVAATSSIQRAMRRRKTSKAARTTGNTTRPNPINTNPGYLTRVSENSASEKSVSKGGVFKNKNTKKYKKIQKNTKKYKKIQKKSK